MGWFAASLKTACAQDLKDQNSMAVNTLEGQSRVTPDRDRRIDMMMQLFKLFKSCMMYPV